MHNYLAYITMNQWRIEELTLRIIAIQVMVMERRSVPQAGSQSLNQSHKKTRELYC